MSLCIVGFTLAITMLLILEKFVLLPIRTLSTKIKEIGKSGDLALRLSINERNNELGLLAETANSMLNELQEA